MLMLPGNDFPGEIGVFFSHGGILSGGLTLHYDFGTMNRPPPGGDSGFPTEKCLPLFCAALDRPFW